jgi:hypothetical protein
MGGTARGFVILTLRFRQEAKMWVGECLELGTATDGRTLKQVHNELIELVELHLDSLEAVGERERFFHEQGIRFYTDETVPAEVERPIPVDTEYYVHAHRVPLTVDG